MNFDVLFINQNSYDFVDDHGQRRAGVSVNVFDPRSKKILKCKSKHLLDLSFGDALTINALPNGRFVSYEIAD